MTRNIRLIDVTLPAVPGIIERLHDGIDVADVGCGMGHAVNLIPELRVRPSSSFEAQRFPLPPTRGGLVGHGAEGLLLVPRIHCDTPAVRIEAYQNGEVGTSSGLQYTTPALSHPSRRVRRPGH